MDGEIEKRAKNMFNKMKEEWEKNEKPKEISKEAIEYLKHIIRVLRKRGLVLIRKEVAEAGLLEEVRELINSEVERRIDAEFLRRVEVESEEKANEKLRHKVEVKWPNWYKNYVEPNIMSNVFKFLAGPWTITCDKCGTSFNVELNEIGIENLIRRGYIEIECQNPNCIDGFILTTRHKIRCELKDLILAHIHSTKVME